jgi:hypothetical protein
MACVGACVVRIVLVDVRMYMCVCVCVCVVFLFMHAAPKHCTICTNQKKFGSGVGALNVLFRDCQLISVRTANISSNLLCNHGIL